MTNLKKLRKIRILQMLPDDHILELSKALTEQVYKNDDYIIHRNEAGKEMFFLLSGKVRGRIPDKADFVIHEGDFFGELALISGAPRSADVIADGDVTVLILSRSRFETELASQPVFSRLLTQVFSERLGSHSGELEEKKLGKYRIQKEIGRGAMGVIYYGTHLTLDMPVAIKMLSHRYVLDPDNLRRFLNEAKIVARLSHDHIRSVIDIEQAYGTYFIIMEYIDGFSLDKMIASSRQLTFSVIREIIYQIADGLAYAHSKGVVHRDVKPGNILINIQGEVKITDFGIAFTRSDKKRKVDSLGLGTPYYVAPEQIRGEPVDHLADIYSFGVLCYELLTGKRPFEDSDALTVFSRHLNDVFIPPEEINPHIPEDLIFLVKKCLEKDKKKRVLNLYNLRNNIAVMMQGSKEKDSMIEAVHNIQLTRQVNTPVEQLHNIVTSMLLQNEFTPSPDNEVEREPPSPGEEAFLLEEENEPEELYTLDTEEAAADEVFEKSGAPNLIEEQHEKIVFKETFFNLERKRQEEMLLTFLTSKFNSQGTLGEGFKLLENFFLKIVKEDAFIFFESSEPGSGEVVFQSENYTANRELEDMALAAESVFFAGPEKGAPAAAFPVQLKGAKGAVLLTLRNSYPGESFYRELGKLLNAK